MADKKSFYDIGLILFVLRKMNSLTQDQMAGILGLSQPTYHRYESIGDEVPFSVIRDAAEFYNMTIMELIHFDIKSVPKEFLVAETEVIYGNKPEAEAEKEKRLIKAQGMIKAALELMNSALKK